jgi:signal transduction histidine kinase
MTAGAAGRTPAAWDLRAAWVALGVLGQDVALGLAFAVASGWAQGWAHRAGWVPSQPAAMLLVGYATGVAIALRRRFPVTALVLVALLYPALYLYLGDPVLNPSGVLNRPIGDIQLVPVLVVLYRCAATGRPRLRWVALLGAVATGLLTFPVGRAVGLLVRGVDGAGLPPGQPATLFALAVALLPLTTMLTSTALAASAVLLGQAVFRQRRTVAELSRRNTELHRLRRVESERTVAAERSRIARELHDVVAHHISAVVIRAQAADRVAGSRPEEAAEAVRWIAGTGQEALTAMRHVVRVLRSDDAGGTDLAPGPTLSALPEVAERLTAVGLPVELHLAADLPPLPAQVDLAAVRIAQEALTNVLVHARATRAVAQVLLEPGMLVVDVQDDGTAGPAEPGLARPGGHGLVGMRERAAACGGELTIGRSSLGGWEVTARLPLPAGRR